MFCLEILSSSMQNISAGLLMCRVQANNTIEFFLVHPGGPFYVNKNEGVWSIPKGIPNGNEDLLAAAQREFKEETGITPCPPFTPLDSIKQKGGKVVHAWMFIGDWNAESGIVCNTFKLEWPPRSGKFQEFPEQDRAEWMDYVKAVKHINPAQVVFLDKAMLLLQKTSQ
jgi:predicted NUDIX family NTP pyrophosphohydrolase